MSEVFCLLLSFGSSLLPEDLHAVDDAEWAALLIRVVSALAPAPGEAPVKPRGFGRRGLGTAVVPGEDQEVAG